MVGKWWKIVEMVVKWWKWWKMVEMVGKWWKGWKMVEMVEMVEVRSGNAKMVGK